MSKLQPIPRDGTMRFGVRSGPAANRPLRTIGREGRDSYRHSADFRARVRACPRRRPAAADA